MIFEDVEARKVASEGAETHSSLDPTTMCPIHSETGKCRHGFKCRFLGAHAKVVGDGFSDELSLIVDGDKAAHAAVSSMELNFVDSDIRKQLRTRKVITFRPLHDHNSTDGLHCGITCLLCTVPEADLGRLPERDPTIARCKGRRNPRKTGDRG